MSKKLIEALSEFGHKLEKNHIYVIDWEEYPWDITVEKYEMGKYLSVFRAMGTYDGTATAHFVDMNGEIYRYDFHDYIYGLDLVRYARMEREKKWG